MYITGISANNFCAGKKNLLKIAVDDVSRGAVDFTKSAYSVPTGVFPEKIAKTPAQYMDMQPINVREMIEKKAKQEKKAAAEIAEKYISESTII